MKIRRDSRRRERGQVVTEYAVMLVSFVALTCLMVLLLAAFSEYGRRLISLIAWEPFT